MTVHLEIPDEFARQFGADVESVQRAVLEAIELEAVRSEKLSVAQARRLLGIEFQYQMDGFLKAPGVLLPLTLDDIRADSVTALDASRSCRGCT